MTLPLDLESLRSIFSDTRTHVAIGKIIKLELATDYSELLAQVRIITQNRDVISRVTWDAIGPEAGSISFPQVDDIVLVEFADGSEQVSFVTRRLSNRTDKIPRQAKNGDLVQRAIPGKKSYFLSDTKILLGQGGDKADPAEPLVLGNVLIAAITDLHTRLNALIDAITTNPVAISSGPGSLSPISPALSTALGQVKTSMNSDFNKYVTDSSTNIVSKLSFTERGQ